MSNAVEAIRLKQELVSFFDNADPKGPEVGHISALHRGHDGYITFHSKLDDNGKPSNKARMTVAIRADALEGMFPQFANALAEDAFFSVNAFAVPKAEQENALTHSNAVYKSTMTRYLCAAHVDIDCYTLGITVGQAIGQVIDAQIEKQIPSPSVYAHSGRGLWLFWFLRDEENALRPPRSFVRNVITWTAIEKKLLSIFNGTGSDSKAASVTQITRIPGSENSKSGESVKWLIPGEGRSTYTYTLKELAEWFGVTQADKNYATAIRRIPNNARGWKALHKIRLGQFELLRQMRGGFREGHRHYALLIYAQLLRKNGVHESDLIDMVEQLGRECIPPHDGAESLSDHATRTAVSVLGRTRGLKFRNEKIGDVLEITPDEHSSLREHFDDKAWPPATKYRKRSSEEAQDGVPAGVARQHLLMARRRRLVQMFSDNPRATYRQLGAALKQEGFSGCSVRSIMLDLERLGLKTRAVVQREAAHHLRQLQDSMLTGCGQLPTRRGR